LLLQFYCVRELLFAEAVVALMIAVYALGWMAAAE
jgi:hypothetical protein